MVVAIHQPNFFPWLGYLSKIARCDVFVFLDDVQFERSSAGTWSNRVKLHVGGRPAWVTVPVRRPSGLVQQINEILIDDGQDWRGRLRKTIRANYARAPHFSDAWPLVEAVLADNSNRLYAFNVNAIAVLWQALRLRSPKFVFSSQFHIEAQATERLIALVRAVGGDTYLAGGGARGYQDDELFAQSGISLISQNFVHPVYDQRGRETFEPGLSCVDALCHCGIEGTAALLREPDGEPL